MRGVLLTIALGVAAQLAAAGGTGLTVTDPWIRAAPPSAQVLAGYLVLRNDSADPRALVGAGSEAFGSVMLHQTLMQGDVATMVHLDRIELLPGTELAFGPGGYHLMLMAPRRPLASGDEVPVELLFDDGGRQTVVFKVRRGNSGQDHSASGH